MKLEFADRKSLYRIAAIAAVAFSILAIGTCCMVSMPGRNFTGQLPAQSDEGRTLSALLKGHVEHLANTVGERNFMHPEGLVASSEYIRGKLSGYGYEAEIIRYKADPNILSGYRGLARRDEIEYEIISAEIKGDSSPGRIIVVGAHYDSPPVDGCRAADDNASGVAGVLELARMFSGKKTGKTLRFVFFPNEEPPFFQTKSMGSYEYARRCKERKEDIAGMISLETIGYFSDAAGSQAYPYPLSLFYPDKGNFIGFVGNISSSSFVSGCVKTFRDKVSFPCEGAALYGDMPGVGWSDHWSFWQMGYPALMVTDTAPFRYPHYHTSSDNPDKLDYESMSRIVSGLELVIKELAGSK